MSKYSSFLLTTGMVLASYEAFKIEGSRLTFSLPVPGTIEKYDEMAGKPGAALTSSIDNVIYRGGSCLPEIRYQFTQAFESQVTKEFPQAEDLKRRTKVTGKKKIKTAAGVEEEDKIAFAEGEAEYVRRVLPILAELRGVDEVKVEEFQPLMDRVLEMPELGEGDKPVALLDATGQPVVDDDGEPIFVTLVRFDPSEREAAERGPKTLSKRYLAAGTKVVTDGHGDNFIAHWGLNLEIPEGADEATAAKLKSEVIGWKIKSLEEAEQAKTDLASKYAVPA